MRQWLSFLTAFTSLSFCHHVRGHVAAWHPGMYCLNGTTPGVDEQTTNAAVQPLYMVTITPQFMRHGGTHIVYQLSREDWWFHHVNQCDEYPPAPGVFLELPAGGTFTVEHAVNRAFTTLAFNGENIAEFGDGDDHPGLGVAPPGQSQCVSEPNIHAQNESMAAGTVFAISYQSEISRVTMENLVVFTVLYNTPWRRLATYSVPALPACPPDGCTCAWGWVANGCGEPNMYMQGFKCKVTGVTGSSALAPARPPVWCEDDLARCVRGAKQMVVWNQLEGNNVEISGFDLSGSNRSPTYNAKMGFSNGPQTDIFLAPGTATTSNIPGTLQPSQTSRGFSLFSDLHAESYCIVFLLYLIPVFIMQ